MKYRNCVVNKCPTNNIKPDKRGCVFCLPRNEEKRSRWLQLLGRDDLVEVPYAKTHTCGYGVCYLHFADRHYKTIEKKSLNTNAYPTPIPGIKTPPIKKSATGIIKIPRTQKSKTSILTVSNNPTIQKSKTPIVSDVREILVAQKVKTSPILSEVREFPLDQKSKTSPILSDIRKIPTQKSKISPILSDVREILLDQKSKTSPILSGIRKISTTQKSKISPILSDGKDLPSNRKSNTPIVPGVRKIPLRQKSKTSPILSDVREIPSTKKSKNSPISIVPESETITIDEEISDPLSLSSNNKIKKVETQKSKTSPISIVVRESETITIDEEVSDPFSLSPDNKIENYPDNYDNSSVDILIQNPKKRWKRNGRLSDLLDENGPKKQYMRAKIEEYMKRAETIKNLIANLKDHGNNHEQIIIENNSKGHSYEVIFKRFLDSEVTSVIIEDPYIRLFHQCQNLVMFCELLVRNCSNLKNIQLVTIKDQKGDQEKCFQDLQQSLAKFNISLIITYSSTLHDRQIQFSTGWTIKIGRGLDYFKKSDGKFNIGTYDYNLRPCHETTIDVFHQSNVKQTYG